MAAGARTGCPRHVTSSFIVRHRSAHGHSAPRRLRCPALRGVAACVPAGAGCSRLLCPSGAGQHPRSARSTAQSHRVRPPAGRSSRTCATPRVPCRAGTPPRGSHGAAGAVCGAGSLRAAVRPWRGLLARHGPAVRERRRLARLAGLLHAGGCGGQLRGGRLRRQPGGRDGVVRAAQLRRRARQQLPRRLRRLRAAAGARAGRRAGGAAAGPDAAAAAGGPGRHARARAAPAAGRAGLHAAAELRGAASGTAAAAEQLVGRGVHVRVCGDEPDLRAVAGAQLALPPRLHAPDVARHELRLPGALGLACVVAGGRARADAHAPLCHPTLRR